MNNKFDELTKSLAQSVSRRSALKRFGVGLAGMALAWFGLVETAEAEKGGCLKRGRKCPMVVSESAIIAAAGTTSSTSVLEFTTAFNVSQKE
jgi:hypothetical protein